MLKIPHIKSKRPENGRDAECRGLPCFAYKDAKKGVSGSGGYGEVFKVEYKNKEVVLKELRNAEDEDVSKEATFLKHLSHSNIVEFVAYCPAPKVVMLEYVYFSMAPFGGVGGCSSLDSLLRNSPSQSKTR